MGHPGTSRYGIPIAPGGVALVQDLLNTIPVGSPPRSSDLLADVDGAAAWADGLVPDGDGVTPPIPARQLLRLRELRTALREAIHERDGRSATAGEFRSTVSLLLDPRGLVGPEGEDLLGAILLEAYAAQSRGDWGRLKLCALEQCDLAFWDRTKNSSARYHSPRCANAVNLRNSRARRREQ